MPNIVLGTARTGVARLIVSLARRYRPALRGAYLASVLGVCSPHVAYDAEAEELLHLGTPRAEDLLNSLPQVNSGLTLGANGASVAPLTGTATADLRGIGAHAGPDQWQADS